MFSPQTYAALDLTQVDFQAATQNGHQQFVNMYDGSGEMETYRLLGEASSAAVQGVQATGPVPVYQELDDDDFYYYNAMPGQSRMGQMASFYRSNSLPLQVMAVAGQAGNKMVLIIDD